MTLTHEEFNDEVDAFVDDVAAAAGCLETEWSIAVTMASDDRLRSVVDATIPLRGPDDGFDGGLAELTANYKLCVDSYGTHIRR